jgi:amino acid efflux transporter
MATTSSPPTRPTLGPVRGTALYVAAVLGPGILTLPALAAQKAGPAFLLALVTLLALSAPLASTFAALGRQFPGESGLAQHVARAFGARSGRVVAALFYIGVPPGVAALGLFGGEYLQSVVGGRHTAPAVAAVLIVVTWALNKAGLRASATAQVALTAVLLLVILVVVVLAVPHLNRGNFAPAAPHGWAPLVPASFLLIWVLTGWEASANLAAAMPPASLRRVVAGAVLIVAAAFLALSVAMVGVLGVEHLGNAPVAELLAETVGPAAVVLGVGLALVLTLGNMNAYVASLAALGASIPRARAVIGGPLTVPSLIALGSLLVTAGRHDSETLLVGVTAASQVPVLILAVAAGARLLPAGSGQGSAVAATVATSFLLVPAGIYLLAPTSIVVGVLMWERISVRRSARLDLEICRPAVELATSSPGLGCPYVGGQSPR